jgi:hypothetical protein
VRSHQRDDSLFRDWHQAQCTYSSPIGTILFNPSEISIVMDDCV